MPSLSRRSPRRYPPKVECPEPKRDGQSLAYTADSSPDLVRSPPECPEQQVGDDESLQSPPRRLYCPVPNLCLRDFGAEERTRTFTLLARCLRVLVPKKGLEPSRCLRVAFEILVPKKGLEPSHPCEYMDLNHARLPIPPLRLTTKQMPTASTSVKP